MQQSFDANSPTFAPVPDAEKHRFKLPDNFVRQYEDKPVNWGFGDLSWVTYKRTYARPLKKSILFPDRPESSDKTEEWWQTTQRVIEGTFTTLISHLERFNVPYDMDAMQARAQRMYDSHFHFKWTAPGRGLFSMGTDFYFTRSGASVNNCGFCSTKDIAEEGAKPFGWAFEMAMVGVGVGFDDRGAGTVTIVEPEIVDTTYTVGDSRGGWRELLEMVIDAHLGRCKLPAHIDYSEIRPAGTPIDGYGGKASGPAPLQTAYKRIMDLLGDHAGEPINSRLIVDLFNISGACVIAGGVRRSAQIACSATGDAEFLEIKRFDKYTYRNSWQWVSNNSPFFQVGDDYSEAVKHTRANGEPGYQWLDNHRAYGRMADEPNHADKAVLGVNPCGEQSLESYELCCLVETYPPMHDSLDDWRQNTLEDAHFYAKCVTLAMTHSERTNMVIYRNRRMGISMAGIVQAIERWGEDAFTAALDAGYDAVTQHDEEFCDKHKVNKSIKLTSVKPGGTTPLLPGCTPGCHWPIFTTYIRRVGIGKHGNPELIERCRQAGYHVEPSEHEPDKVIVEFPIRVDDADRSQSEVGIREKFQLAVMLQRYWADNAVSCTVDFDKATEGDLIEPLLREYETALKGISLLPRGDHGFAQAPYEAITEDEYQRIASRITPLTGAVEVTHDQTEEFCQGDSCTVEIGGAE